VVLIIVENVYKTWLPIILFINHIVKHDMQIKWYGVPSVPTFFTVKLGDFQQTFAVTGC